MKTPKFSVKFLDGKITSSELGVGIKTLHDKEVEITIQNGDNLNGVLKENGIDTAAGFVGFAEMSETEASLTIGGDGRFILAAAPFGKVTTATSSMVLRTSFGPFDNRYFLGRRPGDLDK